MEFEDPAFLDAMRAAVDARVAAVLSGTASRWGTVVSIDTSAGSCVVDLGVDGEKTVTMHMIRPAMAGQEVRIEGSTEDRYVADVKGGGIVVGGKIPGDLEFTARTPDGVTEVLAYGQTITDAQTGYPVLWSMVPAALKSGANLLVPDMRGRLPLGRDDMGGSDAGQSSLANTIGATGGNRTATIAQANLPAVTLSQSGSASVSINDSGHRHYDGDDTLANSAAAGAARQEPGAGSAGSKQTAVAVTGITATVSGVQVPLGGSGTAVSLEQPATVGNWILFLGIPAT